MDLTEWAEQLRYTLENGFHGLAQITVAVCKDAAEYEEITATARQIVEAAGNHLYELNAPSVAPDHALLRDAGYVVLRDVTTPLPSSVPALVAAFQHLVRRDLPVGLLIVGSPDGIKALRGHPAMGFLSRAESIFPD